MHRFECISSRLGFGSSVLLVALAGCSSSSDAPAGTADSAVTDLGVDAKPDTNVAHDASAAETSDDAGDDSSRGFPDIGGGGDGKIDKCAGVSCGIYERCCPSTGKCYDTRSGVCY